MSSFASSPERLFTGMAIGISPERERFDDIYTDLGGLMLEAMLGGEPDYEEFDTIANSVADLEGIDLIRPGNSAQDADFHCVHYAFGVVNGAKWAQPGTEIGEEHLLATQTIAFLRRHWYDLVDEPQPGDIVGYAQSSISDIRWGAGAFVHYGVLQPSHRVVSKFGPGPIAEHPLDVVPLEYGNFLGFLHRRRTVRAVAPGSK